MYCSVSAVYCIIYVFVCVYNVDFGAKHVWYTYSGRTPKNEIKYIPIKKNKLREKKVDENWKPVYIYISVCINIRYHKMNMLLFYVFCGVDKKINIKNKRETLFFCRNKLFCAVDCVCGIIWSIIVVLFIYNSIKLVDRLCAEFAL